MTLPVPASAVSVARRVKPWTVRTPSAPSAAVASRPAARVALTRRYDVSWLTGAGMIEEFTRVAPAMPAFEAAFSAFAHGAMIATTEGPVAVEDLVPGMGIEVADGSIAVLRWIGSITMIPGAPQTGPEPQRLFRVTTDALGLARPPRDVTFGPAARLLDRAPAACAALGSAGAFTPIARFEDGTGIIAINPISSVRMYHLAFDRHQTLRVGGIEVESYHPGFDLHYSLSHELTGAFLSLFPHVTALKDFGSLAAPRYEMDEAGYEPA